MRRMRLELLTHPELYESRYLCVHLDLVEQFLQSVPRSYNSGPGLHDHVEHRYLHVLPTPRTHTHTHTTPSLYPLSSINPSTILSTHSALRHDLHSVSLPYRNCHRSWLVSLVVVVVLLWRLVRFDVEAGTTCGSPGNHGIEARRRPWVEQLLLRRLLRFLLRLGRLAGDGLGSAPSFLHHGCMVPLLAIKFSVRGAPCPNFLVSSHPFDWTPSRRRRGPE